MTIWNWLRIQYYEKWIRFLSSLLFFPELFFKVRSLEADSGSFLLFSGTQMLSVWYHRHMFHAWFKFYICVFANFSSFVRNFNFTPPFTSPDSIVRELSIAHTFPENGSALLFATKGNRIQKKNPKGKWNFPVDKLIKIVVTSKQNSGDSKKAAKQMVVSR